MKKLVVLMMTTLCLISFAENNRIPIPEQSAPIEEIYIVEDMESGDKIVCNQILMIFKNDVTLEEQESILSSIRGKVIGGLPSMQIYQVLIDNPACTAAKVAQICENVVKNNNVIHATPRKIRSYSLQKIEADANVKRKSKLDIEATDRAIIPDNSNTIEYSLELHRNTLNTCQKQIRKLYPNRHGEILFRIYLSPLGEVNKVKTLKSDLKDDKIINCLEYKMGTWRDFPQEPQNYERQVDFTFKY